MEAPALLGGQPVNPDGPPNWPLPDLDVRAALESIYADGSWGKYNGRAVVELEESLAAFVGVPHVATCASGTLAVEIALRALHIGPGDEVILSAYDFEANFLNVHAVGARPVLVDVDPGNACLDPANLEAAISSATKAIIVSHLHGGLVPMKQVRSIAEKKQLPVIEDAAQATGATLDGRKAGAWGDIGIFSFGGSKLLTAGRGGALLIQNAELMQRAKLALARGIQQWAALSELQAAVLLPQLAKLEQRTILRHGHVAHFNSLIADIPGLQMFENTVRECLPAYYKVGFFLDATAFGLERELFVKAMRAEGVAFDAGFRAVHVGRAANRYRAPAPLSNAERAHREIVTLHHPVLSLETEHVEKVALAIRKTYRNAHRLRG